MATGIIVQNGKRIGFITYSDPFHRLRLSDGTCVFMDWHRCLGPNFFKDKEFNRPLDNWWNNQLIMDSLDWFCKRGHRS